MDYVRSMALFILAPIAEIGCAWLVWQGVREHRGLLWIGGGIVALDVYGFVATLQPDAHFARILAAYGRRVTRLGSGRRWLRPDMWDLAGALICLIGVSVIMYAPRSG